MGIIKKVFFLGLLMLVIFSCSAIKHENIIYLLNSETEQSIYNYIKKINYNVAFYVKASSDSTYIFNLVKSSDNEMVKLTNRRLFVNNTSYPIFFETDYLFYSKVKNNIPVVNIEVNKFIEKEISIPPVEERLKNSNIYSRLLAYPMYHNCVYWIVDRHGALIETNSGIKGNN